MTTPDLHTEFIANGDIFVTPVADVPGWIASRLDTAGSDFILSRSGGRGTPLMVNRIGARLFEIFKDKVSIPVALKRLSADLQVSTRDLVQSAHPLIQKLILEEFIIKESVFKARQIELAEKQFVAGDMCGPHRILRCVQQYDDSAVYQVQLSSGAYGALKIVRFGGEAVVNQFRREIGILRELRGVVAPKLLDDGMHDSQVYFVTEWIDGCTVTEWGASLLNVPHTRRYSELRRITLEVVSAYQRLHQAGVIHSDVWDKNVLVDRSGAVRLIDFGLARHAQTDAEYGAPMRGNVEFFKAPDSARALLEGREPPPATLESDIYGLGALLYFVIGGTFYTNFSLDKHKQNEQVCTLEMVPFASRGLPSWPAMERMLAGMLEKDPAQRTKSLSDCVEVLRAMPLPDAIPVSSATISEDPIPYIRSYIGEKLGDSFPPGMGAVMFGVGGLAYALLRAAVVMKDSKLLAEAEYATAVARQLIDAGSANQVVTPIHDAPPELGHNSLFHHSEGISMLEALVAHAACDVEGLRRACRRFLKGVQQENKFSEFMIGKTGLLNGFHQLSFLVKESEPLIAAGNGLFFNVLEEIESEKGIANSSNTYLGFAHGWAGTLYCLLAWGGAHQPQAVNRLLPFLEELDSMKRRSLRGAYWPQQCTLDADSDTIPSWCNGAAGHILLWTGAYRATRDERWLVNAVDSGHHVISTKQNAFNICCGHAGTALSLGYLYNTTQDREWLESARTILARAQARPVPQMESLYKGLPGLELARVEMQRPETLVFPMLAGDVFGPALSVGDWAGVV